MTAAAIAAAFLATSGWSSSAIIGQAVLITVGAVVLGYVVAMLWPKQHNPSLFGFLAAVSLVGGLSAYGVPAATVAIFIVLVVGSLALLVGVM